MAPITRYNQVELGTAQAAAAAVSALIEYIGSPKGLRHMTGHRRAIIWGQSSDASALARNELYLSDGALDAANELRLTFRTVGEMAAAQLPETSKLLFGDPA